MRSFVRVSVGILLAASMATAAGSQSLTYNRGQNVAPAFEGWEEDPDGSRHFVFGYMNRNWEEELDIPIGPANRFNVGGDDRGQPTHFLPRRNRFVFRVPVPSGFSDTDELVWTVTSHGVTESAYASLRPDYKLDTVAKMSETGALGAGASSPEIRANAPPVLKLESASTATVKVGQPVLLVAVVKDDGIPRPQQGGLAGTAVSNPGSTQRAAGENNPALAVSNPWLPPARGTVGKSIGLHLSWFVYRGAGEVVFDPMQIKVWEDTRAGAYSPWAVPFVVPPVPADGRIATRVTFTQPGTYVLRGLADDGGLTTSADVTFSVAP